MMTEWPVSAQMFEPVPFKAQGRFAAHGPLVEFRLKEKTALFVA
jgi:hypothetical protein